MFFYDDFLKESVNENINFKKLPWTKKDNAEGQTKEYNNYVKDIFKKRSKHAFTIIRLLEKTKQETKITKITPKFSDRGCKYFSSWVS